MFPDQSRIRRSADRLWITFEGRSASRLVYVVERWVTVLNGDILPVQLQRVELGRNACYDSQVGFLAFARYDMQLAHAAAFAQIIGLKA